MGLWTLRLIPAESSTSNICPLSSVFIFLSLNLPSFSRPVNIDVAILSGPVLSLCSKGSKQPRRKLPLRSLPCLSGSGMATSLSAPETPRAKAAGRVQGGIVAVRWVLLCFPSDVLRHSEGTQPGSWGPQACKLEAVPITLEFLCLPSEGPVPAWPPYTRHTRHSQ